MHPLPASQGLPGLSDLSGWAAVERRPGGPILAGGRLARVGCTLAPWGTRQVVARPSAPTREPSPFCVIPKGEHLSSTVLLQGPAPFLLHTVWVT